MKRGFQTCLITALLAVMAAPGQAQEPRYANGLPVKGEPESAINDGLVVKIGTATKTIPWSNLSPSTRYRYQVFYRANLRQASSGVSSSNWSNQPDRVYSAFATAAEPEPAQAAATNAVEGSADSSLKINLETYEDVEPMTPIDIPKLEIRSMEVAQFWNVQYGPTRKDTAALVFDAKGPGEFHDAMFIYTAADGRTDKLKGAKRADKIDTYMEFRKIPLQSLFGATKATMEVTCSFAAKSGSALLLNADAELSRDQAKSTFTLRGTPVGIVQGNGQILCRQLLVPPTLWFVLDTSSGKPQLVGNIRMSRLKLIPGRGMDDNVKITVLNSVGAAALQQDIALGNVDQEAKYTIICDLSKLAQNETYTVRASIDLGPFLGPASFEDKITIPSLGKK
jgi:hypothetical protein